MTQDTKIRIAVPTLLFLAALPFFGQAVPAGVAVSNPDPFLPPLDGVLHYALSASELVQFGFYGSGQTSSTTALSGDVAYQGKSQDLPFNLLFAGGVLLPNQQGQGVTTYQNVAVSQGLVTRSWVFNVSDSFSFLPQSPTTGLSGIAGVGDLGVIPVQGPAYGPSGGVLSTSGNRIGNSLSGSVQRQIGHATSISGTGSWSVLHFLNDSNNNNASYGGYGLNTSEVSGSVGVNRRIDARSSVGVDAIYSTFSFSGQQTGFFQPDFQTKGLNLSYQRTLSRSLSMDVSAGPQWVSSSDTALIPNSLNVAVSATLSYFHRYTHGSLSYSRGVNGGSGVIPGALSDSIAGSVGRSYGRDWVVSLTGAYVRTSGLSQQFVPGGSGPANTVFNTVYGGVQATRRINNSFSGFLSYTAQHQSFSSSLNAQNAFGGTSHTFGIGVTFTPRSTRLGQF
ncbi:MAG: hypothetical protein M3Y50_05620 [Acidobacteriota bacterium]|nr:hypothetical protein [Acidobacteriota bacterium]